MAASPQSWSLDGWSVSSADDLLPNDLMVGRKLAGVLSSVWARP